MDGWEFKRLVSLDVAPVRGVTRSLEVRGVSAIFGIDDI